jgi:hypothetical protein
MRSNDPIGDLLGQIDGAAAYARQSGLAFAAHLLDMARLEILAQRHGIGADELAAFCEAASAQLRPGKRRQARRRPPRSLAKPRARRIRARPPG